ncbi:hypothetical protein CEUSTIGMA_g12981.t1 [Chlamydomonas eustigma]|uniref:Uncharacterized protein n=1 Tax=Chlamydomonas eustigma TaxID=1157962 RepID=A0A250XRA1_9CHLO|nr:hypothetical protein CEUSTIGMA_g12981.t1 [Chlamydomonas eustigma]|eukprot:GAX85566.1 hypothetical protein CEUSTIGMA_g12981.t1 [Chlamydomonas eustigma]
MDDGMFLDGVRAYIFGLRKEMEEIREQSQKRLSESRMEMYHENAVLRDTILAMEKQSRALSSLKDKEIAELKKQLLETTRQLQCVKDQPDSVREPGKELLLETDMRQYQNSCPDNIHVLKRAHTITHCTRDTMSSNYKANLTYDTSGIGKIVTELIFKDAEATITKAGISISRAIAGAISPDSGRTISTAATPGLIRHVSDGGVFNSQLTLHGCGQTTTLSHSMTTEAVGHTFSHGTVATAGSAMTTARSTGCSEDTLSDLRSSKLMRPCSADCVHILEGGDMKQLELHWSNKMTTEGQPCRDIISARVRNTDQWMPSASPAVQAVQDAACFFGHSLTVKSAHHKKRVSVFARASIH